MKQKEDPPSLNVYNSATQIEQFLNAVLGPGFVGFIELRMISRKAVRQCFYRKPRDVVADLFVRRAYLANEWNIYFGVCPRKQKKGREENISSVRVLWADIDPKKGKNKRRIIDSLNNFTPTPSIVVDSGHGFHAYWLLNRSFNQDYEIGRIKGILLGLAEKLRGDHVYDLARVMRLPGTLNLKDPRHPLPTRIVKFDLVGSYDLLAFKGLQKNLASKSLPQLHMASSEDIPDRLWKILEKDQRLRDTWEGRRCDLKDQTRSGYDMSFAHQLARYDFTPSETASIMRISPSGKREDATERYLEHTIAKTRALTGDKSKHEKQDKIGISLRQLRAVFQKWLYLSDPDVVDFVFSVVLSNRFPSTDPIWAFLVAPPSGTKTETLRSLADIPGVFYLSSLTPRTLISGQKGPKDESLLPKISEGILIIKDFTTILEMRAEDRSEILAQFREIADGKYDKAFGNGKEVHWQGRLGLVAGVTPIIDDSLAVKQVLGERFIFYRIVHKDRRSLALQALKNVGSEEVMRRELCRAAKSFLSKFPDEVPLPHCSPQMEAKIAALADICGYGRSGVPRERTGNKEIRYVPEAECPGRLAKQFKILACAIAVATEKQTVQEEDYRILQKVALDTIPAQRRLVVLSLVKESRAGREWLTTRQIALKIRYPASTVKLLLEDLHVLGIVDRRLEGGKEPQEARRTTPYEWRISNHFFALLKEAGLTNSQWN